MVELGNLLKPVVTLAAASRKTLGAILLALFASILEKTYLNQCVMNFPIFF